MWGASAWRRCATSAEPSRSRSAATADPAAVPDHRGSDARSPLTRLGAALTDLCERYFPAAFVFALAGVVLVFLAGLAVGERPARLVAEFGNGFWALVPFTMQMALVIVGGFVVATSPAVSGLIRRLAAIPRTPRAAVAFVAFFGMASSLVSWGLSLIFTGLLVREIVPRVRRVDYRAIGAAAYLGLGSVWALGLSSSAALLQATRSAIPPSLLPVTGVIPLRQTIFLWQSLLMATVLIAVSVVVAYLSCPPPEEAKTAEEIGVRFEPLELPLGPPATYPLVVALYSAVLGLFIPSGGGKWIVEAPYVMAAANAWHVHLGWTVQIYNAAEALPNLINPFWMLPLMGILNVRARDLAGYSMLQLLFHVPIVFLLCWLLALTLPYSPPVVP